MNLNYFDLAYVITEFKKYKKLNKDCEDAECIADLLLESKTMQRGAEIHDVECKDCKFYDSLNTFGSENEDELENEDEEESDEIEEDDSDDHSVCHACDCEEYYEIAKKIPKFLEGTDDIAFEEDGRRFSLLEGFKDVSAQIFDFGR